MNTIIIFNDTGECNLRYLNVQDDVSELDGIYINSTEERNVTKLDELIDLCFANGDYRPELLWLDKFPVDKVTPCTKVIECGFFD